MKRALLSKMFFLLIALSFFCVMSATTISGQITTTNNTPVEDCQVKLLPAPGSCNPGQPPVLPLEIMTDENGNFVFTDVTEGNFKVMASKPGFIPGLYVDEESNQILVIEVDADDMEIGGIDIQLLSHNPLFGTASGIVTNTDSTLAAGVMVGLFEIEHPEHPLHNIMMTNPEGAFLINHIEMGTYKVAVYRPCPFEILGFSEQFTVDAENLTHENLNVIINVPVLDTYAISGTVRDINNIALAHKFVEIIRLNSSDNIHPYMHRHGFTNELGQYSFNNILPGNYIVKVRTGFFMPVFYPGTTTFDEAGIIELVDVNLTDMDITIPNDMFVTLSGSVKDAVTALPISNVIVSVDLSSVIHGTLPDSVAIPGISAITDVDGNYSLVVPFGRYRLVAYTPDGTYSTQFYDHQNTPFHAIRIHAFNDVDSLDFDLTPVEAVVNNSISGTVLVDGQTPTMPVMVVAVSSDEDWEEVVISNTLGGYTIPIHNQGSYYVIACSPMAPPTYYSNAYNWEDAQLVNVDGLISDVNFNILTASVDGPLSINGQVMNSNGLVASNISIALKDSNNQLVAFTSTDENGQYLINNIPSQEYQIIVSTIGVNSIIENINVTDDASYNYTLSTITADTDQITPAVASTKIRNYPNPFNPETNISFTLAKESKVSVDIYNSKGQRIRNLTNEKLAAGTHNLNWNGKDSNGKTVSSGIYFCKVKGENFSSTGKMVLMK